jgi:hypothetical protein
LIFGLWGTYLVIVQSRENAGTARDLNSALDGIKQSTDEVARLQTLNSQLQTHLLSQSQTIARLAQQGIDATTGANTFCYLSFSPVVNGWTLDIVRSGKNPLRSVEMRIVDKNVWNAEMERMHSEILQKQLSPFDAMDQATVRSSKTFVVGDFARDFKFMGGYPYPSADFQDLDVLFSAFNGTWLEQLTLRKVNGHWLQALYVDGQAGGRALAWNRIDPGFPLIDGKVPGWPVPNPGTRK